MTYEQRLKQNFCFCQSGDRYDTDPGGQTTYHDGHKIVFSLWRKWIREAATEVFLEILQGLQLY